jgi:predicted transcriptional regulator
MSNLQKFEKTISDFESEVDRLKSAASAYQKLEALHSSFNEVIHQFDKNSKLLENINKQQEVLHENIEKRIDDIFQANEEHRLSLIKLFDSKTEQIRKENKDFYRDLEETIRIRLDENKAQIKHLIEDERTKIKEIFEAGLQKQTGELKSLIDNRFNEQTNLLYKGQKTIKIMAGTIGGITVLSCIAILIKLFLL